MLVCQSLPEQGMVLRSTYNCFQPGCVVLFEQLQLFATASRRNGAQETGQDQTVSARRMLCLSNRTKRRPTPDQDYQKRSAPTQDKSNGDLVPCFQIVSPSAPARK
ncbi:unnamed protein product, partial [Ectocarpus sp. 8 AP-2014]